MNKLYDFSLYLKRRWKIRRKAAFLTCTVVAAMVVGCLVAAAAALIVGAAPQAAAEMIVTGSLYRGQRRCARGNTPLAHRRCPLIVRCHWPLR